MDLPMRTVFQILVVFSLLCSLSTAESTGSVFFIDSNTHQYLRSPSQKDSSSSVSISEVGAAVSVLLGFAPPTTLSAAGSTKLNEILMPKPFDRPRAVLALEITGMEGFPAADAMFTNAIRSKVLSDSVRVDIELPGDEVSVVSLDKGLADISDNEISNFASWLGGSYAIDGSEALNGEITIPLPSGSNINLHMSKKADLEFVLGMLSLFHNSRRAMELHEDLSQSTLRPAELVMGRFDGIKALKEVYGPEGEELFVSALVKMIDSVQEAYKGQIVVVIFSNGISFSETETTLNVMLTTRPSARWLEEKKASVNETLPDIARVFLVRKTLAWITGIILIISTLLGIHFLLNMPLTRDTLLYSNVKLD